MSVVIRTGDYGPAILALLISAVGWVGIVLEKRRRRLAAAAKAAEAPEGEGGPSGQVRRSLPLSREVFEHFRAMGPGWQARIDEVLKLHVREEEDRARRAAAERSEGKTARVAEEREAWRGEGKKDE
jgi:hypothetical protein